ncbi:MAG: hypothetical protein V4723_11265 [Pseudomonadota bacterium]
MSALTGNAGTLDNLGFALLARLHVILRRQKARITDIEYMRTDPDYFDHVLALIDETDTDEVQELCVRLKEVYLGKGGLFALLRTVKPAPVVVSAPPIEVTALLAARSSNAASVNQKYVGRLR